LGKAFAEEGPARIQMAAEGKARPIKNYKEFV